ncbi:hypothetical protein GTW20_00470 [Nocardiopsis alba]|uniref:Putative exodeoxyribonuclease 8 PDDEXK-like domain-containing protein n=1 Tax=Nocardiopsis alba TaxID=53437 RepID=A0A7K2IL72_9ACTN|nr:hypothetical protein [Nocardiopsis alba]MYR30775.1 hypothetical protein [Nocardiopsis alba]
MQAVTQPGVYDLPEAVYHADPVPSGSLSSTGARKLLECPAKFHFDRYTKKPPNPTFDFGSAAHKMILGEGPELVVIDADSYRTKDARDARDAAYGRDAIPLLPAEYRQIEQMAAVLSEHPVAAKVFSTERGLAERSLFWVDDGTGVWCRARVDHLPEAEMGAPYFIASDFKTTKSADPKEIGKAVYDYGYHIQAAWYLEGIRALRLHHDLRMVFVFQEKSAPFLVTVIELDGVALRIGHNQAKQALATYKKCSESGVWPGYSDRVETIALPAWAERKLEEEGL